MSEHRKPWPVVYELFQATTTPKGEIGLSPYDEYDTLKAARHEATSNLKGCKWVIMEKQIVDTNLGKPLA